MEGGMDLKQAFWLGGQMEPGGLKQAQGNRGNLVSLGMARVGEADSHRWGQTKSEGSLRQHKPSRSRCNGMDLAEEFDQWIGLVENTDLRPECSGIYGLCTPPVAEIALAPPSRPPEKAAWNSVEYVTQAQKSAL
jgi:hypothetical protein